MAQKSLPRFDRNILSGFDRQVSLPRAGGCRLLGWEISLFQRRGGGADDLW